MLRGIHATLFIFLRGGFYEDCSSKESEVAAGYFKAYIRDKERNIKKRGFTPAFLFSKNNSSVFLIL